MTKIKRSYLKNIKSVNEFEVTFDGATAYIIGGNTKGKTTFIKFLLERLNGNKFGPDILNNKTENGIARIDLTDGCSFEYTLMPDGKEKLVYIHKDVAVKATKDIIEKYVGKPFDIDAFLQMQPKQKTEYLLKIFNINIQEERDKLNNLINDRRTFKRLVAEKKAIIDNFDVVEGNEINLKELYDKKDKIINEYDSLKRTIEEKNKAIKEEYQKKFDEAFNKMLQYNSIQNRLSIIHSTLNEWIVKCDDFEELAQLKAEIQKHKDNIRQPGRIYTIDDLKAKYSEPQYESLPVYPHDKLKELDEEIQKAIEHNNKLKQKQEYILKKEDYENTVKQLQEIENEIEQLENTIKQKLLQIKLPDPISIDIEDMSMKYDGRIFDAQYMSTSELYIAALLLGSLTLKELKTMHFDCSPLDKVSMQKVIDFAQANDLQLLIERPDFEAGELRYEIIEH